MSITPQAIKDQEFQVKFRGYDAIEVKAYLELLAEEFFELHEVRRRQEDEYAELYEEVQAVRQERDRLLDEGQQQAQSTQEGADDQGKDEEIAELKAKVEEFEQKAASAELEKNLQQEAWERQETELRDEIDKLRGRLDENQNVASESTNETEKLRGKIELLEQQLEEFKKEEVDFKAALLSAQRFAEDVKSKAKDEAEQMLEQAIREVETYREQSEKELAHLPVEIEELRTKKNEVREELKKVLTGYFRQLDLGAPNEPAGSVDDDLSELFQSIPLNEEDMAPDQIEEVENR